MNEKKPTPKPADRGSQNTNADRISRTPARDIGRSGNFNTERKSGPTVSDSLSPPRPGKGRKHGG